MIDQDVYIIDVCLAGDPSAFRVLFDRYRERAYAVAYRYLGNHDDAMDAVQESFLKAYQSLRSFNRKSSFYTWFCRILINVCIDLQRKAKRRGGVSLDEMETDFSEAEGHPHKVSPAPDAMLEQSELRARIDAAIMELPPKQRMAFVLSAIDGLPYKEIAKVMNCSIGTVMSRIFYARKRLQNSLQSWMDASADDSGAAENDATDLEENDEVRT